MALLTMGTRTMHVADDRIAGNWSVDNGAADDSATNDGYCRHLCDGKWRCRRWGRRRCASLRMVLLSVGLRLVVIADNWPVDDGVTRNEAANDGHRR